MIITCNLYTSTHKYLLKTKKDLKPSKKKFFGVVNRSLSDIDLALTHYLLS